MRLFLIILFSVQIFANDLVNAVVNFNEQNIKIHELSQFLSNDEDKSINKTKINNEINDLKAKKTQILAVFSTFINNENLSKELLKEIKKEKIDLNLKKAKEHFYECLIAINSDFTTNDENNIKDIIDEHLKKINTIESKNEDIASEINSYVEILTYLRVNANIFDSNYIFKKLDTNKILNKFNGLFSDSINAYINPGKIFVCLIILGFIFVFKKILLKILFFVILRFFNKNKHTLNLLTSLTKPIIVIFYVYGLWLCTIISFYPAPIMPIFVMVFGVINTILFAWLIITILNNYGLILISQIAKKSNKKEVINLMLKILYFIIIFIAILIILAKVGFDISTIIASLGIGGLAVALAAKDIIANFFASVLMLFDNSFSQGDWIEVNGIEGTIVETGLRKTTIRTFDNCLVFLPNSTILNGNIKNYSKRKYGRRVKLSVGVTYDATPAQIESLIKDIKEYLSTNEVIANSNDEVFQHKNHNYYKQNLISVEDLEGFKSSLYVWLDDFAASSINIQLYFYIKNISAANYYNEKSIILMKIMKLVEKNGLSFAFPSTSVYIEKMPENKHFNTEINSNK